jgi:hypothetical protein
VPAIFSEKVMEVHNIPSYDFGKFNIPDSPGVESVRSLCRVNKRLHLQNALQNISEYSRPPRKIIEYELKLSTFPTETTFTAL